MKNPKIVKIVSTHMGLFTYTRLPFGVSSSQTVLQRTMDSVLQGISNVTVYLDDIILTMKDDKDHQTLDQVRKWLENVVLRFNRSKCQFMEKREMFRTQSGHKICCQPR